MSLKLMLFVALITLAYAHGRTASKRNQELTETDRNGRTLIEVPIIGTIFMMTFKISEFLMSARHLIQYKLAAFTLVVNVLSWLYHNFISIIIGSVVLLEFCVITGAFAQEPENELDHRLIQAARQLEAGALKYARMIN